MTSVLSVFKRYRELVIASVLLLYPFVSLLTHGAHPRKEGTIDRAVLWATSPIERAISWTANGVAAGWNGYVALHGVETRNVALKAENARLRGQVSRMAELSAENAHLAALARFVHAHARARVSARIIGVNPVSTFLSVRIDRGTSDGVEVGMPVVTPEGVFGEVIRVDADSADVVLIEDPNSEVAVRLQRSRARGTAVGAGGHRPLTLENLLRTVDAKEGDAVVTAGTDGIFPPGLLVGHLEAVHRPVVGMFQSARIHPAVEPTEVEEVLVLTPPAPPELADGKASSTRSPKRSERRPSPPPVKAPTPARAKAPKRLATHRHATPRPAPAPAERPPSRQSKVIQVSAEREPPSARPSHPTPPPPTSHDAPPVVPEAPPHSDAVASVRPTVVTPSDEDASTQEKKAPAVVPLVHPVAADGGRTVRRAHPASALGSPVLRSVRKVAAPAAAADGGAR